MIATASVAKYQSYINDVLSGDVVVCELVRKQVERHVADMEQGDGFPYYFSDKHASFAIDFIESMCCHSIGDCAGEPFLLEPWQAFAVAMIFGWRRISNGSRRFRKVYWSMGRKNGKSTIAAAIAILLAMLDWNPKTGKPESVADVILSATKKDQAYVIFEEIERMRGQSEYIAELSSLRNRQLRFAHNDGRIRCVPSDKPFDGLNPHGVIIDELHAFREHHRQFFNTMMTGSGFRVQPLTLMVTTAGNDQSLLWQEQYDYAESVAIGTIDDPHYLPIIYQLDEEDDPLDPAHWIKANPNLEVSVKKEYIEAQAREAAQKPLDRLAFIQYHANRRVSASERAFNLKTWDAAAVDELSDWEQADAICAAVDLGSRDDFAAYALCARFLVSDEDENPVYRYEVRAKAYIAEDTHRDLTEQPFAGFINDGSLIKSRFPTLQLRDDLIADCEATGAYQIGYDPAGGQIIGEEALQEGFEPIRIGQNCAQFNEPIREMLICLDEGRFAHDGNPMLRWCVDNAVLFVNPQDRYMFDKASSKQKIDPVVAFTMAFRLCTLAPQGVQGGYL